jgi:hypothetical protein
MQEAMNMGKMSCPHTPSRPASEPSFMGTSNNEGFGVKLGV